MPQDQMMARSPLAPQTTMTVDERLAMYNAKYNKQQEENEQEQPDLFAPQVKTEDEMTHDEKVDKWLAPVAKESLPSGGMNGSHEHIQHFIEQFDNDPAIREAEPLILGDENNPGIGPLLAQAIKSGQMTYDEAMQMASRFMDQHITPILDKHHSDTSKDRSFLHPDVLGKFGVKQKPKADGRV